MKKILFIHHAAGWGGAPLNLINIINSLDRSKYEVEVLLLKNSNVIERLSKNGIKFSIADSKFYKKYYQYFTHSEAGYIKWFQTFRFFKLSILWLLSHFYFAKKEIEKHEYDIVHLNSSVLTDWLAPAKQSGKVIMHIQEPFRKGKYDILHVFFKRQIGKYADHIIAISEDNAERIGIPEKTEVIYNYSKIPKNEPPENSYSSKKVLYLGGSSYIKGFYTMVEALDYLDKDVKVYFGGFYSEGKNSRNLLKQILKQILSYGKKRKEAIEKMRNHSNAIEIGITNNVQKYLDEVCCLISPFSVPHFSRPVIEAHLHKKPAICSDVKGMDEIIKHEENGLVIPKDNPKELAGAINALTADSNKAKMFGKAGYDTAIRKFSPNNIRQFQYLYDKLIFEKKSFSFREID
jgi:glycosyltransferase involved in cell wall biosynthesis